MILLNEVQFLSNVAIKKLVKSKTLRFTKMKFSIKDFSSEYDQIHSFHLFFLIWAESLTQCSIVPFLFPLKTENWT